ncbi:MULTISPECIES: ATP-binding protein [unclassified Coleofasciculus]|uniref:ATP-binding protein n=1 Tax=unclassified Coleofasciculus TaxID=2692782 RepID=UPI0018802AE5|nr:MULTISPECIES: ATP-binding protein [unclassified Coleofasciculus]MBE9126440.1 PAS domain S-box protein [Coleofasciculus sp. LEGE 07081]MBE9148042.1 PAS domain S-box protein [Coleofasciculus sp. LEGE 07092]
MSPQHLPISKRTGQERIDYHLLTAQGATINQIAQVTRGVLVLKDVLQASANQLREVLQVSGCLIFSASDSQPRVASLDSETLFQPASVFWEFCEHYRFWHNQEQHLIIPDLHEKISIELQDWMTVCGLCGILVVPLLHHQSCYGAISLLVTGNERQWMPAEITFVQAIADQWAIAFYQTELEQHYQTAIQERQKILSGLQASEARHRALLEVVPDAIFRVTRDGIYLDSKAAKADTLPISATEIVGKHLHQVLPKEVAGLMWERVEQALETNEIQIVEYQLWLNSKARNFEARIVESGLDEVSIIVQDITERVQGRLILEQVNDALEERVEKRTAALRKTNEVLKAEIIERQRIEEQLEQAQTDILNALAKEKELSDLKSRFITVTSHEFRTPLTTIQSSAELMEHYGHKLSQEKKLAHLHRIQISVNYMTKLLNDVLMIGKADAGKLKLEPEPFDLESFCRTLAAEMQLSDTNQHAIAFTCNWGLEGEKAESPIACMDKQLLRQILENLLSNGMKYSPTGSTIRFTLNCDADWAVFEICDRGIGIPTEDQERLFEAFHRATNAGTIAGTGLGLAIVKKCVEIHHGQIGVDSEIGVGTTFTVTLPLYNSLSTDEHDEKNSSD